MTMRVVLESRVDEQLREFSDRTSVSVANALATGDRPTVDPRATPTGALLAIEEQSGELGDNFIMNRLGQRFALSERDQRVVLGAAAHRRARVSRKDRFGITRTPSVRADATGARG